jgi:hypothetical protein
MSILLTPAKAAILLGTSDRTVRSMIQRRILPATAIGHRMGGRQGPVRYEIALEDLHASGLSLDLARLPLITARSQSVKETEQEPGLHDEVQPLFQALKEEYAQVQALRRELEGALTELRNELARLETKETGIASPIPQRRQGYLTSVSAHTPTQGGPSLIEGPPSGLIPFWMPDFGARIRHNVERHLLVIDNSIVALTPTEYRLVMEILSQYVEWQTSNRREHFVGHLARLKQVGHLAQHLLRKHLSNVNTKLNPFGLRVQWDAEGTYTLLPNCVPGQADTTPKTARKQPGAR